MMFQSEPSPMALIPPTSHPLCLLEPHCLPFAQARESFFFFFFKYLFMYLFLFLAALGLSCHTGSLPLPVDLVPCPVTQHSLSAWGTWTLSHWTIWEVPCCSVARLCPNLCDLMDCSTPGASVFHDLLEFAQIQVH